MSFGIPVRNGLGVGLLASTFLSSLRIGGRPAMSLDFIGTNSLDSRVTFTRATTATFVGSDGLIQTAAINAPRFDYDPVTLAPKGLLIEESRTNALLYSEQFDNAVWAKANLTVTANATASPDGAVTADKLVETATTAARYAAISAPVAIIATTYALSVYLKASERTWAYVGFFNEANKYVWFDLSNGVVGTIQSGVTSASIQALRNGWYRCTIIAPAASINPYPGVSPTTANGVTSYVGNGTSGIFAWGADFEAGAFATSYIPTTLLAVTRNTDAASMTGTNFSSWYNQTEGSLYVQGSRFTALQFSAQVAISDGTTTNEIFMGSNNPGFGGTSAIGSIVAGTGGDAFIGPVPVGSTAKMIIAYGTTDGFSVNGSAVSAITAGQPLVNRMFIGARGNGSNALNGHIRQIAYYNTRLPDTSLRALTA